MIQRMLSSVQTLNWKNNSAENVTSSATQSVGKRLGVKGATIFPNRARENAGHTY